jgi:hypothetical protein
VKHDIKDIETEQFDFYERLPKVITEELNIKPVVFQAHKVYLDEE